MPHQRGLPTLLNQRPFACGHKYPGHPPLFPGAVAALTSAALHRGQRRHERPRSPRHRRGAHQRRPSSRLVPLVTFPEVVGSRRSPAPPFIEARPDTACTTPPSATSRRSPAPPFIEAGGGRSPTRRRPGRGAHQRRPSSRREPRGNGRNLRRVAALTSAALHRGTISKTAAEDYARSRGAHQRRPSSRLMPEIPEVRPGQGRGAHQRRPSSRRCPDGQ